MTVQPVLVWLFGSLCVSVLLVGRTVPERNLAGTLPPLVVIAVAVASATWLPEIAGTLTSLVFLLAVGLPAILAVQLRRAVQNQRLARAEVLARLTSFIVPFRMARTNALLTRAARLAQQDRLPEAFALLDRIGRRGMLPPITVDVMRARFVEDWHGVLDRLAQGPTGAEAARLESYRLRGLGEVGRLSELIASYPAFVREPANATIGRLVLFCFAGRVEGAERVLDSALRGLPGDCNSLWLDTARLVAGRDVDGAWSRLRHLAAASDDHYVRRAAAARLVAPLDHARARLTEDEERELDRIEAATLNPPPARRRLTVGTLLLLVANVGMFAFVSSRGGSTDIEVLYRYGGMLPSAVIDDGEWWRLPASMFLHFGVLHIALNMVALALLGPAVEAILGRAGMLVVYLASGIGAAGGVLAATWLGWIPEEVLVGASGAIFGLVGALVVRAARDWWRDRTAATRARLANLGVVLLLQVAFDLSVPEVSFADHACGLAIGLAITALWRRR